MAAKFDEYEVLEKLGEGGMGRVYKARQAELDRVVALKVLNPEVSSRQAFERFKREAAVLDRLRHPNIVRLFTMGRVGNRTYFTMDYIDGRSLEELIREAGGPEDRERLVRIVARVARAVHYAHGQGVIHRDLKPSNIIVAEDGTPYITDFGLAREVDAEFTLTMPGTAVGTAAYISPEQAEGDREKVGPRSDVYGLGAMLYEVLTGRPPFEGPGPAVVLKNVCSLPPVPPGVIDPTVGEGLEAVCLKCLAKRPEDRYASAEQVGEDLERWLQGAGVRAPRRSRLAMRLKRIVRLRAGWLAAGAACLAVAGLIVGVSIRSPEPKNGSEVREPPEPNGGGAQKPKPIPIPPAPEERVFVRTLEEERESERRGRSWEKGLDKRLAEARSAVLEFAKVRIDNHQSCISRPIETERSRSSDGMAPGADPAQWSPIRSVDADPDGAVWFATDTGLIRMGDEGEERFPFATAEVRRRIRLSPSLPGGPGLRHAEVTTLHLDPNGGVWVGTAEGRLLHLSAGQRSPVEVTDVPADGSIQTICSQRDGTVWVGVSRPSYVELSALELLSYDGRAWQGWGRTHGLPDDLVNAIAVDGQDRVWAAVGEEFYRFEENAWRQVTAIQPPDPGAPDYVSSPVRALTVGPQRDLWLTRETDLLCYRDESWRRYPCPELGWGALNGVAVTTEGVIWVGSERGLLCGRVDGELRPFFERDPVQAMTLDSRGDLWAVCGTEAYRVDVSRAGRSLAANAVSRVAVDPAGNKWFATARGVSCFDNGGWKTYESARQSGLRLRTALSGLTGEIGSSDSVGGSRGVRAFAFSSDGAAFLATHRGIIRFRDGCWVKLSAEGVNLADGVLDVAFDGTARLWAVTETGAVVRREGRQWRRYPVEGEYEGRVVRRIAAGADDSIWCLLGGRERGSTLEGPPVALRAPRPEGAVQSVAAGRPGEEGWECYPRSESRAEATHDIAVASDGSLWCALGSRIARWDGGGGWTDYEKPASCVAVDPAGRLWAGGDEGLHCFDGRTWRSFDRSDGLLSTRINDLSVDLDGSIWAATDNGVSHIALEVGTPEIGPPKGQVTTFRPRGEVRCLGGTPREVWLGTDSGAWRLNVSEKRWSPFPNVGAVNAVAHERGGEWWFGTDSGLISFDGNRWQTHKAEHRLLGAPVGRIVVDREKGKWMVCESVAHSGTPGDVGHGSERIEAELRGVVPPSSFGEPAFGSYFASPVEGVLCRFKDGGLRSWRGDEAPASEIDAIFVDPSGRPWVSTGSKVMVLKGQNWVTFTDSAPVRAALEGTTAPAFALDARGRAWFAATRTMFRTDARLVCIDGTRVRAYSAPQGTRINALRIDSAGNAWLATDKGLLSCRGGRWSRYGRTQRCPEGNVSHLEIDRRDNVWFVGSGGTLYRLWRGSGRQYPRGIGPVPRSVLDMAVDREGRLWCVAEFTTTSFDIYSFDGERWLRWQRSTEGLEFPADPGDVETRSSRGRAACDDKGRLWIAASGLLTQFDTADPPRMRPAPESMQGTMAVTVDRKGMVRAGGSFGLASLKDGAWQEYADEEGWREGKIVLDIAADTRGGIWVLTGQEPYGLGPSRFVTRLSAQGAVHYEELGELSPESITCIAAGADGKVWFGTERGAVVCWDGEAWHTRSSKVVQGRVRDMAVDERGRLWLAWADEGDQRRDGSAEPQKGGVCCLWGEEWQHWTTGDGIASADVRCVVPDHNGGLWVGTAQGVSHIVLEESE